MSNIKDLSFIRRNFLPVLPLVYDDALSYIEQLGKVTKKINEVIQAMNDLELDILGQANAYTDAKVEGLDERIDSIIGQVNDIVNELRIENAQFIEQVNSKVSELEGEVNGFNNALVATANTINARTDMIVQQNNEALLREMQRYLANILVLNYITGEEMSIQDMFNFLCLYHLTDSITYGELATKNCSYQTLANYLMTYTQLVTNGGSIIQ